MAQGRSLTSLPDELLNNIFKSVTPWDLAALARTCRQLLLLMRDNRSLYKEVYLGVLDEPPDRPNNVEFEWIREVQKYVKMHNILDMSITEGQPLTRLEKTERLSFVTDTIVGWLHTALPVPSRESKTVAALSRLFGDGENKEAFFQHSTIFSRARRETSPQVPLAPAVYLSPEERQMSARLHVLYGVPMEMPRRSHYHAIYPYACSVVYDLRNYKQENLWGPYKNDGQCSVDWERLEAVMIVLGHNIKAFTDSTRGAFAPIWNQPWFGVSPDSFVPATVNKIVPEPSPPSHPSDPFNVSGTWMRIVCFLDFSELFSYNFNSQTLLEDQPRPPLETTEATRLIIMEISVVRVSDPSENEGLSPIVYFEGASRSMHTQWDPNANSKIKGTVRLTREGEVRWKTISVYQEEERWASEGIQIGGAKSARGVLGHWFDKDLDHHGPAGPTAFWKVSNDIRSKGDPDGGTGEGHGADDDDDDTEYEDEDEDIEVEIEGLDDVNDLTEEQIAAVLQAISASHGYGHGHGHTHTHGHT